jgi:hypothetical protein
MGSLFDPRQERFFNPADLHCESAVANYLAGSGRNIKDCALEGGWKASLSYLVTQLTDSWADIPMVQMPENSK